MGFHGRSVKSQLDFVEIELLEKKSLFHKIGRMAIAVQFMLLKELMGK
jgi:hypothetical protein